MNFLTSESFASDLRRLVRRNPLLASKIRRTLKLLQKNPQHPSLRLHKIDKDTYSISVDMKIRILIAFKKEGILLRTIGSHDEVYR